MTAVLEPLAPVEPRWLTEDEMTAWLSLVAVVVELPQALDRQLREDAGIGHVYYQILAMLSAAPEHGLRMGELARKTGTSMSRLSHAVSALEEQGWVARCPSAEDKRGQFARLTDTGADLLVATAPGHVAEVRRLVFDRLDADEVRQLATIMRKLASAS